MTVGAPVVIGRLALAGYVLASVLMLYCGRAGATDFYELQIYYVDTTPQGRLMTELHSNYVSSATGSEAKQNLPIYQIHNTLELTYGILPWLEVGQYLCTARLSHGIYEYAGARTKMHFGLPFSEAWPISFGANIEFQYMRRAAVTDPLNIEFMPIVQGRLDGFFIVGNFSLEKQFSGPGTHQGIGFEPAGQVSHKVTAWLEPSLEYYGELGAITHLPRLADQQQFLVPSLNLYLDPALEFNVGYGVGLTSAWRGRFFKGTVGWLF